ncbi:hypothetical protein FDP41_003528 [Naegleria fowleri]|uniref:Uncharacterized protein n=1 Tax=Naegleria fowleri TaxID=5763 RepID=A0A6A5BR10_NAEFO|nr:uncharacterized protein FDP41_003528 [Naegleria fowleri]KAF0977536.1 hypothetical protein FDP41_003528 [Naegleria fowleri]CAG4709320.1 unnamed protein product [Naegleria fowleri]
MILPNNNNNTPSPTRYSETPIPEVNVSNSSAFYSTHDNGGRPFLVEIRNDQVNIYENAYSKPTTNQVSSSCLIRQEMEMNNSGVIIVRKGLYHWCAGDSCPSWFALIKEIKQSETPFEVFVGEDNNAFLQGYEQHPDESYHGASILIRFKSNNECWHVGICVTKFILKDEKIEKLCSPVGNSDVVYPYLVTDSNIYVIEGDVSYRPKHQITSIDPYDDYYSQTDRWTKLLDGFSATERVTSKDLHPSTELTIL